MNKPIHNTVNYYRGEVIGEFANIELFIKACLSVYFLQGTESVKSTEFNTVILDRMNFESLRQSLKTVCYNIGIKNGFKQTKTKKHPNSTLFEEINSLNAERNKFAHYYPVVPTQKEYLFGLLQARDSIQYNYYSQDTIDSILKRMQNCSDELQEIFKKIVRIYSPDEKFYGD